MDALVLEIRKIVSQDLGAQVPYTQSGIYQPAPAAYQPAPAAYQPAPAAYQPTPAAYQPAPTAYQPAPGSIPVNKSQNYGVITQKLVCSDCGFENSPGNRFCGECGKKLQ
jgi:hypothetical protein